MTVMSAPDTVAVAPAKQRRPRDRRDQILRQAFGLISASGFNAVSLGDVAVACGIRKSSVLHHFPSMTDLLLGVLQMRELEDYDFYRELRQDPADGPEQARAVFTQVFEHNLTRPAFVRLYTILGAESLAPDHPAHDFFDERTRRTRAEMVRSLAWKPEPQLAAGEFLAFWDGLETAGRGDPDFDVRAVWQTFCDRFFV